MPLQARLLDEAKFELGHAVDYHDGNRWGLGVEFFAAYEEAIAYALERPHAGSPARFRDVTRMLRKYRIGKFYTDLVVTIVGEELVVIALADHHRKPGYWRDRLKRL
jgi:hypothetical protein